MACATYTSEARTVATLWTSSGHHGNEHLRVHGCDDGVAGVQPQMVVEPGMRRTGRSAALGGCRRVRRYSARRRNKARLGNPPKRADVILSTARLNRVIEHAWADLTVRVEAGCTMKNLQNTLAEHGQRLALDPLWPERATVGGILSTNESGTLRIRYGSLRDLIIGVTIALPEARWQRAAAKW